MIRPLSLKVAENTITKTPDPFKRPPTPLNVPFKRPRLLTEIGTLMEQVKKSKRTDVEAGKKVRANWDKIDQICRENRATINRQYFHRGGLPMRSLNPDF